MFFIVINFTLLNRNFVNPKVVEDGIIFTDYMFSSLYLYNGIELEKIFSSPNCGLYYSVHKNKIGFKMIYENGLQAPCVFDLKNRNLEILHKPSYRSSEVSFSNEGYIAYMIEETLFIKRSNKIEKYLLGNYANLVPLSPSGDFIVFNDDNDQLFIYNLKENKIIKFTDDNDGYFYPVISPDQRFIAYSTISGIIKVYDVKNKNTYNIGRGHSFKWCRDSKRLIFHRFETDDKNIINSDIFISSYDGKEIKNITSTEGIFEIEPLFSKEDEIIFFKLDRYEIYKGSLENLRLKNIRKIFSTDSIDVKFYNIHNDFGSKDSIDVPYIHQVYDTPDWHNGHWSCAPTTAVMAIAYYRRLPEWDTYCSYPYTHISHFGNYIASRYNFREVSYTDTAYDAGGNISWGGYGYMWTGGYSPYSRMYNYLSNHNLNSWIDDTPTWNETISEIQAGYPYCMCVGLTTSGHLVLAVGQVLNWHTLIFNDPYGNKNTPGYPSYDGKYARYDWPGYNNGYQNLNNVYWTRGARGTFTDLPDTIVDDEQYMYSGENFGFYMYNQPPSDMRYYRDKLSGYKGHFFWTYSTGSKDTCYVIWKPRLTISGNYEVFVYIPSINANANAHYKIYYDGGSKDVYVNQNNYSDEWVSLGTYPFSTSGGYLYLGDATGIPLQKIAFDAAKWSYRGTGIIDTNRVDIKILSNIVKDELVIIPENFYGKNLNIQIFDINGRVLRELNRLVKENEIRIKLNNLKNGVYFVKINADGMERNEKFVIISF
uniref:T9SS type A sorting domain-containing protein n=1 Tax=candidate division WOR-3 bacterium TaxID=2052148 RepID=A0A7C4YBP9_UNCW3